MTTDKSEVHELDEANTETQRLRKLVYAVCNESTFGRRVVRGFLVKRMGGEHHRRRLNADVCFQPLSTLKLLPYLHALVRDRQGGAASLDGTTVSWVAADYRHDG